MSRLLQLANILLAFACTAAALMPTAAEAKKDIILYRFLANGSDGQDPAAGLVADALGNLYGTTEEGGGTNESDCGDNGCGAVFKLAPDGTETVLHGFTAGSDGAFPLAPLILDDSGNLYGTTSRGGSASLGLGVVFTISAKGKESVLYAFTGGDDGADPQAGLVMDGAGNLYGTAEAGGASGAGTVFKLTPRGKLVTLYSFLGGSDGATPAAGLLRDATGNFYGTTLYGGVNCDGSGMGCGTVFKISPKGDETLLYAFQGGSDGANSTTGVTMNSRGELYGTTYYGGIDCDGSGLGCGVVYKLTAKGEETVIHAFAGGSDGANPETGNLVMDGSGALYGTTPYGGAANKQCGCGVAFKVTQDGKESVLHAFGQGIRRPPADGWVPLGSLLMDTKGNLYGTTMAGGFPLPKGGSGTVFEIPR